MAKLTALEVFNAVTRNCGEAVASDLANLVGLQLVIWDKIIEATQDISTDGNTKLQFLEATGLIPMVTGQYQYEISALTAGSDLMNEDRESFHSIDNGDILKYRTQQEWIEDYPSGIASTSIGYPSKFTKYGGYFIFNNCAGADQNGKNITFKYWKLPSYYSVSAPTGTGDIPEPFDRTCLVALATLKVLLYLGSDEAQYYKVQVFGNGGDIEGSLDKMKRIYSSPILKARVKYVF